MNVHAGLTRALEARYYTDPGVFEKEKAGLLARTWQFAGHVSQLAAPGDYFTFEIAGQNLFCVRGRDGDIRTFYNVCQHRAHEMVSGAGHAKLLVCPYHSWTYELSGELRGGPNLTSVAGFDRKEICLTGVRTEVFLGFIFVNLDDDAKPMDEWFPRRARGACGLCSGHRCAAAARMGRDCRELQLENLCGELFGVLSLPNQPPDIRHRGDQAGDL